MDELTDLLPWSSWRPLAGASRDPELPPLRGLSRIRRKGRDDLDDIGETGKGATTLRKRLGMLRGIYGDLMPYRAPHTAGPALWALYHQIGEIFEVSIDPVEGSTPWRNGLAAVAIACYRQKHGRSPTVEFGRMPVGYRASSSYNWRRQETARDFGGTQGPRDIEARGPPYLRRMTSSARI